MKSKMIVLLALPAFLFAGCATFTELATAVRLSYVESWEDVPEDHILLVGEFDLDPPYASGQQLNKRGPVAVGTYDPSYESIGVDSFFAERDMAWGELSFIAVPSDERLLVTSPQLVPIRGYGNVASIGFGDFVVTVPEGAKAIYVGNIIYGWDREMPPEYTFRIEDDFDRAVLQYQELFGTDVPLLRADVRLLSKEESDEYFDGLEELIDD